jgi:hypothetical protein
MINRSNAKSRQANLAKSSAAPKVRQAVTAPVLEHLSEVASLRLADHQQRFRKDYKASRQSVDFLSKMAENDDTAPIELLLGVYGNRVSAKTQATQDLVRIRDENAELILAAQQNSEKITLFGDATSVEERDSAMESEADPSAICNAWRRSVFHFSTLALMAAQQSAQLQRRERQLLSVRELAKRTASVMEENKCLTCECAALEQELGDLEREGEWLDVRMTRWNTEESFFDTLPEGEVEWKRLFFQMQKFVKETQVPQRQLEAVKDIVDAVVQMTGCSVHSALPS